MSDIVESSSGQTLSFRWVAWVGAVHLSSWRKLLLVPGPTVDDLSGPIARSILIGLILASAFSAILVYAQELLPNRVGMISGLLFGLAVRYGRVRRRKESNAADVEVILEMGSEEQPA